MVNISNSLSPLIVSDSEQIFKNLHETVHDLRTSGWSLLIYEMLYSW